MGWRAFGDGREPECGCRATPTDHRLHVGRREHLHIRVGADGEEEHIDQKVLGLVPYEVIHVKAASKFRAVHESGAREELARGDEAGQGQMMHCQLVDLRRAQCSVSTQSVVRLHISWGALTSSMPPEQMQ